MSLSCTLRGLNYIDDMAERIRREVPSDLLPEGDTDLLFRMYAVLALGEKVEAANVHDAWSAWMSQSDPSHESIQPFGELPMDVRSQDGPFAEAMKRAVRTS